MSVLARIRGPAVGTKAMSLIILSVSQCAVTAVIPWDNPVPLTEINGPFHDMSPYLSRDGLSLYYSIELPGYGVWLFEARRAEPSGPFNLLRTLPGINLSGTRVAYAWISSDGLRMYYHADSAGGTRLMLSRRSSPNEDWPTGLGLAELNALGSVANPSLTDDELVIVFTGVSVPGGVGGWDLWMATRTSKEMPFVEPVNLEELNSPALDFHPSISPDGLTLYFGSRRNGPSQIFVASRASRDEPFGRPMLLPFFGADPNVYVEYPCQADGGKKLLLCKRVVGGEPFDIYVCHPRSAIPNLIAHWRLDEGLGPVAYDSVADRHALVYGAAPAPGRLDGALRFEWPDDYVFVPPQVSTDKISSDVTISLWVRLEGQIGPSPVVIAWADQAEPRSSWVLQLLGAGSAHGGAGELAIECGGERGSLLYQCPDNLEPGRWYHLALTKHGRLIRMYVDGRLGAGFIVSSRVELGIYGSIYVGARPDLGFDTHLPGLIDDLRLYDRALTQEEIASLAACND